MLAVHDEVAGFQSQRVQCFAAFRGQFCHRSAGGTGDVAFGRQHDLPVLKPLVRRALTMCTIGSSAESVSRRTATSCAASCSARRCAGPAAPHSDHHRYPSRDRRAAIGGQSADITAVCRGWLEAAATAPRVPRPLTGNWRS